MLLAESGQDYAIARSETPAKREPGNVRGISRCAHDARVTSYRQRSADVPSSSPTPGCAARYNREQTSSENSRDDAHPLMWAMQGDISSNNRRRNRREGIIPRMRILNQNLMKSATIRLHFSENSFSVSPTKAKNFGCHSQPARPYFDEHVMWQVRQQSVDEPPQHRSLPIAAKPLLFPFFFFFPQPLGHKTRYATVWPRQRSAGNSACLSFQLTPTWASSS